MGVPLNESVLTPEAAGAWGQSVTLPNGMVVGLVQPAAVYTAGQGIAIYWPSGPQIGNEELIDRARTLGTPWAIQGWPGIGVILSQQATGAKVIERLTAGQWTGTIPILIPPELHSPGKLIAEGQGAAADLGGLATDLLSGLRDSATVAGGLARALPWILLGGAVLVAGVLVYKVVK